jgi:hypothetical protein
MNGRVGGIGTLPHQEGMKSICSSNMMRGIAVRVRRSIGGAPSLLIAPVNPFLNTTMRMNVS